MNNPLDLLTSLENAYDPSSPAYKFSYVFYNLLDDSGATYPVEVKGYDDLAKRNKQQKVVVEKIKTALMAMSQRIDGLKSRSMIISQRMNMLVKQIRKLRGYQISGNAVFGKISDEKLVCSEECVKYLKLMRIVLHNFSEAVKKEINK